MISTRENRLSSQIAEVRLFQVGLKFSLLDEWSDKGKRGKGEGGRAREGRQVAESYTLHVEYWVRSESASREIKIM